MPEPDAVQVPKRSVLDRRSLLIGGAVLGVGAIATPLRSQLTALAGAVLPADGYGTLGEPDDLGLALPAGFTARLVGRSGDLVGSTGYRWPWAPDGGACFPAPAGFGHVYVANSEVGSGGGGVSAVEFDADGAIVGARSVLTGTSRNCAGGATPWDTWLSCEEVHRTGLVWECDPYGGPAVVRPAMGAFQHEAVAVHEAGEQLFLTEDRTDGRLYRFLPDRWPDLATGVLQAANVTDGTVTWKAVDPTQPERSDSTTAFNGGEGIVVSGSSVFFATKGDRRIWELDLDSSRLSVFHDCISRPDTPLDHVDNLAIHPVTGHLFVAEDGGDVDLCMLVRGPDEPFVTLAARFVGHAGSELTGPAFSADGRFLYLSSQRGVDGRGVTVQISGPFLSWISEISTGASARRPAERAGNAHAADPAP